MHIPVNGINVNYTLDGPATGPVVMARASEPVVINGANIPT